MYCQLFEEQNVLLHFNPRNIGLPAPLCAQQQGDQKPLHSLNSWGSPSSVLLTPIPIVTPSFEFVAAALCTLCWKLSFRDRGLLWEENLWLYLIRNLEQLT